MRYRVVCVSQVTAAGGDVVGHRVAERLGLRYVDDEVLALAADHAGLDPALLHDAEHHKTLLARLADMLVAPPAEVASYFKPRPPADAGFGTTRAPAPPAEALRRLIQDAIVEIARQGSVLIAAHAASIALAGKPDVLRVHVVASMATRVERLWLPNKLVSEQEYAKEIEESDRQRQLYLERFYGVRAELPMHYDLVVNTDALELDQAVAVIVAAVA